MKKSGIKKAMETVFPKATEKDKKEIDMLNVIVLRRFSFLCAILEFAAFILAVSGVTPVQNKTVSLTSTGIATVLCIVMSIVLRVMDKKDYYNHIVVVTICNSFSMMFILWSMAVSGYKYINGAQIITFYAVIVVVICFMVMIPKISFSIISASFIGFYIFMYHHDKAATVQTFNYFAFMLICCAAATEKYSVTIATIRGRFKAEELNDAYLKIMRHDPLSKVKNRTALIEDLPNYFDKKIIVMIFDLDKFKTLNDSYGHIAGDSVISSYAKTFSDIFGKEYVYRFGGDEFLVVRVEPTEEQFNSERENLRNAVNNMKIEGIDEKTDYSFGFSFGVAQNGEEFEELIIKADNMLYEQKSKKHNSR